VKGRVAGRTVGGAIAGGAIGAVVGLSIGGIWFGWGTGWGLVFLFSGLVFAAIVGAFVAGLSGLDSPGTGDEPLH
jgi:hypothetical protein